MPYYLVQITLNDGKLVKGVKEYPSEDVDLVFKEFRDKVQQHYKMGCFHAYDCMKLSRWSSLYHRYLTKHGIKYNPLTMVAFGPDDASRA